MKGSSLFVDSWHLCNFPSYKLRTNHLSRAVVNTFGVFQISDDLQRSFSKHVNSNDG